MYLAHTPWAANPCPPKPAIVTHLKVHFNHHFLHFNFRNNLCFQFLTATCTYIMCECVGASPCLAFFYPCMTVHGYICICVCIMEFQPRELPTFIPTFHCHACGYGLVFSPVRTHICLNCVPIITIPKYRPPQRTQTEVSVMHVCRRVVCHK